MYDKKEQLIVVILTLSLLSFYAVVPALGASENTKLKVISADGVSNLIGANKVKVVDGSNTTKLKSLEESANENKVYDKGSSSTYTDFNGTTKTYVDEEEEPEAEDESLLDKLNPLSIGKKMVGEGGIYFLELLGDAGFKVGGNETSSDTVSVKENYGQAVALIYTLATIEFDPFSNPFIKDMQLRFGIVGLFLIIFFIMLGAFNVNIYAMTSAHNADKAWILSNRYHIPINEYALTIAEACAMMSIGYAILRITIMIELLFTKLIMFQILDRIVPTGGNIVMYLMMSLCYLIIGIAIAYRILIIGIFCASYIVFIGLYCFGITRPAAIAAWWYYIKMLFLRTIIVGVTSIGVGIISYIQLPRDTGIDRALGDLLIVFIHPILYAALVLILVAVCIIFIVGIKNVISTTKMVARRYTYGGYR